MQKKTLVIGASANTERYSNMAVKRLKLYHHPVIALGNKADVIDDTIIQTELKPFENIDTVTLYINPSLQKKYYEYILFLKPARVIFNPGTENEELEELCKQNNIYPQQACTLVLLNTHQY